MLHSFRYIAITVAIVGLLEKSYSQTTGKVDLPNLGISFTIPEGWVGQLTDEAYVMGSNTEPGLVLMTAHKYSSLDELRTQAKAGIQDENGTSLRLSGELSQLTENVLSGEFEGTIEWQQARAFMAGVSNPYGQGVSIMVATDVANYSARYVELGKGIVGSLKFSKAKKSPIADEWKQTLNDSKLTYMDSDYSSGGYSTGSGYSSETEIHLCAAGYFQYSSNNSFSFDTGGGFGGSSGGGQGAGNWDVVSSAAGDAVLQLNFNNGEVYEYTLAYEDSKTYLNGTRYFKHMHQRGQIMLQIAIN